MNAFMVGVKCNGSLDLGSIGNIGLYGQPRRTDMPYFRMVAHDNANH
jgi:hypothetical protein